MSETTYEEACRCPKCKHPGEGRIKRPAPREAGLKHGTMIHQVYCVHELCPWYNTAWMIQVNADGSVNIMLIMQVQATHSMMIKHQ
ncbi:MAG: hypothetical protein KDA17_07340 [Candidatus Saccharibacteria bacterium]|nr:hypothetical protein [Candidatus Saccharibacteria bacterium]